MELRFTLKSITGTWYFVLAAKIVVVQKVTDQRHSHDSLLQKCTNECDYKRFNS